MTVTVGWNPSYGSLNLVAKQWTAQGEPISPETLSWDSDVTIWGYSQNNLVYIEGHMIDANGSGETWITRPGTTDRVCAETQNLQNLSLEAMNHSQPWLGRLIEKQDINNRTNYLCLSAASSLDSDKDGLSDYSEREVYGTDINEVDSDGDGFTDTEEVLANSDPLDVNSTPNT